MPEITTEPVVTEPVAPDSPVQLPDDHPLVKTLAAQKTVIAELKAAKTELEQLKQSQLSDAEKAIVQAREEGKAEGRAEATSQWSGQAINAEFKAAFADRDFDIDTFLESANTSKFLTDDGQINSQAIRDLADKLAPKAAPSTAYVQGKHQPAAPALNSNALIESVIGLTGGSR